MPIANRWLGLLFSLMVLILIPFTFLERPITQVLNNVLEAELDKTLLAGIIAFFLASDVVLPVPSSLVNTTAGAALGFGAGTMISWVGMSLGCLIGYWLGSVAFTSVVQRIVGVQELERAQLLGRQHGPIVLAVTRAVPILAEASVIATGFIGVPQRLFFIITGFSNLGVSAVYTGIGAFAFEIDSFLLAFSGAILVPGVAILFIRLISPPGLTGPPSLKDHSGDKQSVSCKSTDGSVEQHFSVAYRYGVYFTHDIFDPSNLLFVRTLVQGDSSRQHGHTIFVDDGVTAAWPNLQRGIEHYTNATNTIFI